MSTRSPSAGRRGRGPGFAGPFAALVFLAGCAGAGAPGSSTDLAVGSQIDLAGVDLTATDAAGSGPSCNPANETLGAAGGPDVCAYGQVCDETTSTCQAVPNGSCKMVTGAPAWDATTKTAPVIARVSATLLPTTNASSECVNGDPAALVTVDYYAPMNLTSTTTQNMFLSQVKFKKSVVATDPFYDGTFMRVMPGPNQKFGSFKVGINCGGAGGSVKTAGFYIRDEGGRTSNLICVSW